MKASPLIILFLLATGVCLGKGYSSNKKLGDFSFFYLILYQDSSFTLEGQSFFNDQMEVIDIAFGTYAINGNHLKLHDSLWANDISLTQKGRDYRMEGGFIPFAGEMFKLVDTSLWLRRREDSPDDALAYAKAERKTRDSILRHIITKTIYKIDNGTFSHWRYSIRLSDDHRFCYTYWGSLIIQGYWRVQGNYIFFTDDFSRNLYIAKVVGNNAISIVYLPLAHAGWVLKKQ